MLKHLPISFEQRRTKSAKSLVALITVAGALALPTAASADSVRLYEHINLQGASFTPSEDQPDFRKINCSWWWCTNWNDRVSSLHVPAYTCVTLYEHINYGGASRTYCGDRYYPNGAARNFNLDSFWNDRASSSREYGQLWQS